MAAFQMLPRALIVFRRWHGSGRRRRTSHNRRSCVRRHANRRRQSTNPLADGIVQQQLLVSHTKTMHLALAFNYASSA